MNNNGIYQRIRIAYQKPEIRVPAEVLLSVFASLFLFAMAIRPTLVTVSELRKKIEDQGLVETKLETKIRSLIQAQAQLADNESSLALFERAVPENYAYANLAKKLEVVALEEVVNIESLGFSSAIVSSGDEDEKTTASSKDKKNREWLNGDNKVKEFTINFSVIGNESSVVNFLERIENLDRSIIISRVEIARIKERNIALGSLRASGIINGYYLVKMEK